MRAKVKGFAGVVRVAWAAMCAIASGRDGYIVLSTLYDGEYYVKYTRSRWGETCTEIDARLDKDTSHNA